MKKTTLILSVVLALLVALLIGLIYYPIHMHNKMKALDYEVWGGMTDELTDSEFYEDMQSGKSFCFMGDSITRGSVIWDIPWYEPLLPYINGEVSQLADGGWVVNDLIKRADKIPDADVYVIAIGINDVLSPYDEGVATTAEEYTASLQELLDCVTAVNPEARVYFISPWIYFNEDPDARGESFREAQREWCNGNDSVYIDPLPAMLSVMDEEGATRFMFNGCHPTAPDGVGLYSYGVLEAEHLRRVGTVG
jgi:hypothetical protein